MIFWVEIFLGENVLGVNFSGENFFCIILKYSIVRISFVDLRWAQLYVSLVFFCGCLDQFDVPIISLKNVIQIKDDPS